MKVYIVGAGPGNPEWLTVQADRLLRQARICIYAGSLINPQILELLPEGCERHDSAAMALDEIIAVCREASVRDLDVIRLHTGEPSLYGAIGEQMDALAQLGVAFTMVPGVSAFQAAAAALQCELTAPEIAQTVILTRAAGRTPVPAAQELENLAPHRATLCIYLSTHQARELCAQLRPHYGDECPAAAVYHASWPDERIVRGSLATLPQLIEKAQISRNALLVVGEAIARPAGNSRLYDAAFAHGYRKARV